MAAKNCDDSGEEIITLIDEKKEHKRSIVILDAQKLQYKDEVDLQMNKLEVTWRQKEVESITAKVAYLRYRSEQVQKLRAKHDEQRST